MTTKGLIQQWQMMRDRYVAEPLAQRAGDDLSKRLICLEKEREIAEASLEISENMRQEIRWQLESVQASKRPAGPVKR